MNDIEFNELQHPRATDGKFSTKDVTEAPGGLTTLDDECQPPMSGVALLDAARRAVARSRSRRSQGAWVRVNDEDIVGDAIEICLRAQARGQNVHFGYVNAVVGNLVARDRDMASSDAKAIRLLSQATARLEQEQGHEATQRQVTEIARSILDEWPDDSRKPSATFYRRTQVVSLDDTLNSGTARIDAVEDRSAAFEDDMTLADSTTNDAAVYELLDRHEKAFGRGEHMAIKRAAWNALADITGAPKVSPHLSKNKVTAARTLMTRHPDGADGAIREALTSWDNLEDNEYTDALFAPFGTDDVDERRAVVDQLRMKPEHAADLWVAALAAANTAHDGR